jgi:outer membrane immunogenic protein
MKKILLSTVAICALACASGVFAADMPVKAMRAAPPPLPAFSWTGCYAGAQAGWGWGKNDFTHTQTVSRTFASSFAQTATAGIDTSGAVFGGQIGCDWQVNQYMVFGVQGMIAGTDINGLANVNFDGVPSNFDSVGLKTKWLGSVTGSLGFTNFAGPDKMLYVKGGGAWAGQQFDRRHGPGTFLFNNGIPEILDYRVNGWTVGVGAKWAFAPSWDVFVEYNHYGFGKKTFFASSYTAPSGPPDFGATETNTLTMKSKIETVSVGVTYRLYSMR